MKKYVSEIHIDNRPAGAGKTESLVNRVLKSEGKELWIISQPTIKLLRETYSRLKVLDTPIRLIPIDSESDDKTKEKVRDRLKSALKDVHLKGVLLITHHSLQALKAYDLTYHRPRLAIDEMPNVFGTRVFNGKMLETCKDWLDISLDDIGRTVVTINSTGIAYRNRPEKGFRPVDGILNWIAGQHGTVYLADGRLVGWSIDPKVFGFCERTYVLSATHDSGFFGDFCESNGIRTTIMSHEPCDSRVCFSPYYPPPETPDGVGITVYYLYDNDRPMTKAITKDTSKQVKLGRRVGRLFEKGGILEDRKDRAFAVLNVKRDALKQAARISEWDSEDPLKKRIITSGTTGINHLSKFDTVIYLASANADSKEFTSCKNAFDSAEEFGAYNRFQTLNSLYQCVWRSKLRDLRIGEPADIRVVVFGKYEAELMARCLQGTEYQPGLRDIRIRPASPKLEKFT